MDLFQPGLFDDAGRKRSKNPPGYIPLFDDALLRDERVEETAVTPEERDSVLASVGALTGGTISRVGDALAMPGDYLRGALVGKYGERVTGREMNRMAGLAGPEDNWLNWAGGVATEVITDPLAALTGPMKALTPAGKAAAKLAGPTGNLLETAPTALSRKAISTGMADDALPMVARRNKAALEATGRTISTFDPAMIGKPLYGQRTAQRAGTLDDLIKYADDPDAAEQAARNLLGRDLDTIRNQPLSKSFGLGLPFGDPLIVGDPLGKGFGDKYADALDTFGQWYRWTYPGRVQAAAFDGRVGGAIDAEEQLTNAANWQRRKVGGSQATMEHTLQLSRLHQAHPEVFGDEEGNRILGRYLEGPAARTAEDVAYVESRPQLKAYADWWGTNRERLLGERRAAGLTAEPLKDEYGIEYLPRRAEASLEMEARRNRQLGNALSAFTSDALRRTDAMRLPGGRDTIIDLSRDTAVSGSKRTLTTDEAAGQYIVDKVNAMLRPGQPPIDLDKGVKIARILNKLPDDVVQKSPLFGQHPTEMIGSYMRNQGEALGTAETLADSVATFATNTPYRNVEGGKHISIKTALDRLGLKTYDDSIDDVFEVLPDGTSRSLNPQTGAAQQMRERLAKLTGVDPDEINLHEWSVPEEHINRLTRARDAFTTDQASSALMNWLDSYTAVWRGAILAWPSRSVRDLYSGGFSNWLAGALDPDSIRAAKALVMEGPQSQKFLDTLRSIGRYSGDDGINQFYADLAATGLVSGGNALTDAGASVVGKRALDALVGSDPISLSSVARELGTGWNRKDFFTMRTPLSPLSETRNPMLRAGERMNSLTDNINRLTGYLSLLKQGYDPMAAAAAMKRAHVDYTSLTTFERTWLKRLFPWYSYQSRIFREVLRQLAERPGGRYGQLIRASESLQDESDDGVYVPSSLRSQFAIPIPEELGGVPAPGTRSYLKFGSIIPGFSEINNISTPGTISGGISDTIRKQAMQLHPAARMLTELATGQDLYTRQPLGDATSALDVALRAYTGDKNADVPAVIDKAVELIPFTARPLGLLRSLTDARGDQPLSHRAFKAALNNAAGVRVEDVDQRRVLGDATRQIAESIDPFTREFSQTYIPEHLQPRVPQWALQRQKVSRALERELRDLREAGRPKKEKSRKKKQDASQLLPTDLFQ